MKRIRSRTVPGMINLKRKPLSYLRCMKYRKTKQDYTPAMSKATRTPSCPRSMPAAETVNPVNISNPSQT